MTDSANLRSLLRRVKIFQSLDPKSLDELEKNMHKVALLPGDIFCSEGEEADRMYVISNGELRVLKAGKGGQSVEITRLGQGDVAGEMCLFERELRSATLEAAGEVELWEIEQRDFQRLLDAEPGIARALISVLSRNLRRETKIVAELSSHDADNRLKVAVFDSKPYIQRVFEERNSERFALKYFEARLSRDTVSMAKGFKVICAFVNDMVDAEVVKELGGLGVGMIAMRCAGVDNVDLKACEESGIDVTRVPEYSPYAVAEHAVALMLAVNRHIHRAHNRVREGNFSLNGLVGFDMHGKTVGIVGTGKIGACAVRILAGFGCNILAQSRSENKEIAAMKNVTYVDLDRLLRESEIISLHAPLTALTHHVIGEEALRKTKRGVMLINTSRGGLVDTKALIQALLDGRVGSAGLDVFEEEGGYSFEDFSDDVIANETLARLTTFNNVVVTSHMAFLTREVLSNIADTTFSNVEEYVSGSRGTQLSNAVG